MAMFLTRTDEVGEGPFDSIAWALEIHVKAPDSREFNAGMLFGNEDAPSRIEFWRAANPGHGAEPDFVWAAEAEA